MPSWSGAAAPSTLDDAGRALQGAVTREWNWRNFTLTAAGTADVKTLTYSVAPAAYYNGQRFAFIANTTNTGSVTLNVNGLGAKTIKKGISGALSNLASGDMVSGVFVEVAYNLANDCFVWTGNSAAAYFSSIELGNASDTTITRSAAGVIAVEGGVVPKENRANTFTAAQTINSTLTVGASNDLTPDANWSGQLNIAGASYTGGIALNATGMWVGHNSAARALILATDETERVRVTAAGGVSFGTSGTAYGTTGQVLISQGNAPPVWGSAGATLLGTLTTTSGTSQTLSSLVLTSYKFLRLVFNGVSGTSTGTFSFGSFQVSQANAAGDAWIGIVDVDLATGIGSANIGNAAGASTPRVGSTGYTTASTSVALTVGAGNFDAGSVAVYGVA
jgi:hypothetical protein